ncbi:formyltransferase family protein [Hydrogenivirga sp.]
MCKVDKIEKVAVLTSRESWFLKYAEGFTKYLNWFGYRADLFTDHNDIKQYYDVLFILSYFKKVPQDVLNKNKYNLVVHESDLPKGRGWSPLFWQILEGRNRIPIVLIEASEEIDAGDIYIKDYVELTGSELHDEIRRIQAEKTIELCIRFLRNYKNIKPMKQIGEPTYYRRRTPTDSELNIDKSIKEQFNLLRIVNNEEYPAFFRINGIKYILKIYREDNSNENC